MEMSVCMCVVGRGTAPPSHIATILLDLTIRHVLPAFASFSVV